MTVYRFAVDTDQSGDERFDNVLADQRSDVEQRHSAMSVYDPDNPDVAYARMQADEIINVSGAEVWVYIRTENSDYDRVWDADPDPTYWDRVGMKAFFKPAPVELELKKWGADTINRTEIVFSHRHLFTQFGQRMLRAGDVIVVPFGAANASVSPKSFRVTNASPSGNYKYNWLYFTCQVETLTADVTVRPPDEVPMQIEDDQATNGVFRESI